MRQSLPARRRLSAALTALVLLSALPDGADEVAFDTPDVLGEALFFDTSLSRNRSLSCATCHDPGTAFTDPRETAVGRVVSLGDDGDSLGDRSAPSAAYAAFTKRFHKDREGCWIGGTFWDGREPDLEGRAARH